MFENIGKFSDAHRRPRARQGHSRVHALFGDGPGTLPADVQLKGQHLCQGRWLGREQAMPRVQRLVNYLGTSGSNLLWLEKLCFVPPAQAYSQMTCRSRGHNYMEMVLCLETSKNPPLLPGRGSAGAASTLP